MGPEAKTPPSRHERMGLLPMRRRDTRPLPERVLSSRAMTASALAALAAAGAASPLVAPLALAAGAALAWKRRAWLRSHPLRAPHDLPEAAAARDPSADGIAFLGRERDTGREVWLSEADMRQHLLVLGTTGAGKTEALLGIAANALSWGGGFTYVDAKGDVSIFAKVFEMCERFDRVQDLLVLNFMTGGHDMVGQALSNSMNPFRTGGPDYLCQLVVSMMDDPGGDGSMWRGRATSLMAGVLRALCWLRDNTGLPLDVGILRDHMALKRIVALSCDERIPQQIRRAILSYLSSLPGYRDDRVERQAQTTLDQHGYLEMQFTKILGPMADVYGHIFRSGGCEVDMRDVVLNRRILVVMLPALEKSGDEIANLGKIVVAALKGTMGSMLGSDIGGTWNDVMDNRATTAPSPYVAIFDDAGYYMVEGSALMAAQSRSLGVSMVYASQDIPALKRNNEREAESIIANTSTKVFMHVQSSSTASLGIPGGSERISYSDLASQAEGEMHIAFRDNIVRARGFYVWSGQTEKQRGRRSGFKLRLNGAVPLMWERATPDPTDAVEEDVA